MRSIKKDLALLFAGATASVIGSIIFQPSLSSLAFWILVPIVFILIMYGSGAISKLSHWIAIKGRSGTWWQKPKVGILSDMGWDLKNTEIMSCTDIGPYKWQEEVERHFGEVGARLKTELVDTKRSFDSYAFILNPYGGVYPERNLRNFETLSKIFEYVSEGGIFVNVADIPGYWAYNPLLKRSLDATPTIYGIGTTPAGKILPIPVRPFELTPFMRRLGLRVFNVGATELLEWEVEFASKFKTLTKQIDKVKVHRVAVVEKNVEPIFSPKKLGQDNVTPVFLVNYGDGKFLISLIFESNCKENNEMKGVLSSIIIKLVNPTVGEVKRNPPFE